MHDWDTFLAHLRGIQITHAYHYTCTAPLYGAIHNHECRFHIQHLMVGNTTIHVGKDTYDVGPGDTMFVRPGQSHESFDDAKTYYELIEIHFQADSPQSIAAVPRLNTVTHVHNAVAVIPALERLIAEFPDHAVGASATKLLAWTYAQQGRDSLAIATEERLVARWGGSSNSDVMSGALLDIAHVRFNQKRYKEALVEYEKAAQSDPLYSTAWVFAGDCYFAEQHWSEAETRFRKAAEIEPLNGQALRFLSDSLAQQGKKRR